MAADVAVVPVIEEMGLEMKVMEYLSCGVPTVVTPSVAKGIEGLIDGENALISDCNQKSFCSAIIRLLEDKTLASELSRNGRRLVENRYSWTNTANVYSRLFERIRTQS